MSKNEKGSWGWPGANVPGWWHRYDDILPDWFELYLGLEQSCAVIRTYEPQRVPGLLQTQECARAVIQLGHSTESADEIERRIALRMARQEFLSQPGAPNLWAVIDEAALWRLDGRSAMRTQIQHLIAMAELPNITPKRCRSTRRARGSRRSVRDPAIR